MAVFCQPLIVNQDYLYCQYCSERLKKGNMSAHVRKYHHNRRKTLVVDQDPILNSEPVSPSHAGGRVVIVPQAASTESQQPVIVVEQVSKSHAPRHWFIEMVIGYSKDLLYQLWKLVKAGALWLLFSLLFLVVVFAVLELCADFVVVRWIIELFSRAWYHLWSLMNRLYDYWMGGGSFSIPGLVNSVTNNSAYYTERIRQIFIDLQWRVLKIIEKANIVDKAPKELLADDVRDIAIAQWTSRIIQNNQPVPNAATQLAKLSSLAADCVNSLEIALRNGMLTDWIAVENAIVGCKMV